MSFDLNSSYKLTQVYKQPWGSDIIKISFITPKHNQMVLITIENTINIEYLAVDPESKKQINPIPESKTF